LFGIIHYFVNAMGGGAFRDRFCDMVVFTGGLRFKGSLNRVIIDVIT